jgi:putative membrane-bound dehydrogenase-like protein
MRFDVSLRLLAITLACATRASTTDSPLPPDKELASFHFADSNLTADLIVAEPDVISPVCVAWDADGRMFVVEMTDYPLGPKGGRVRLLEDRDGDGRFERAIVFADNLPFPTSVLPWRDGVLVAAAPDIWFLRDTNGDGQADERRVLFTGFGEGNQQLRVNGLTLGLDNWVYGANGRSDGEIRRPEDPADKKISIRRRDFRFRIDPGEGRHVAVPGKSGPPTRQPSLQFEAIAGQSQFGTAFDDWGNRFLSWNTMPFRHVVIETRYLDRVPQLAGMEPSQNLQPPGDDGRIFPLTAPPQVFNNESQTHFNASAGTSVYRGDALGEEYKGNIFVGEPLRNLVHRRVLVPRGVTFEARRGEEGKEFLASTDPWFHPVYFAAGPDGALYVVDFYRQFVEHPGYVPEEMRNKVDWRIGAGHGRIWRIRPKNWKPKGPRPNLSRAKSSELVKHLSDANAWWRVTAQRLLVERQDKTAVPALEKMARGSARGSRAEVGGPPTATLRAASTLDSRGEPPRDAGRRPALGRLYALYTLTGLGALKPELIVTALRDSEARSRLHGIRLSEEFLASANEPDRRSEELRDALFRLVGDEDAHVRLQLALTLGRVEGEVKLPALARLTESAVKDRWQSLATLASVGRRPWLFWKKLNDESPVWLLEVTDANVQFVDRLAALVGSSDSPDDRAEALGWLNGSKRQLFIRLALFDALAGKSGFAELRTEARAAAESPDMPDSVRNLAIRVLGKSDPELGRKTLLNLLASSQPPEVQAAAARALAQLNDGAAAASAFARWSDYSKVTRRQLVGSAARSSAIAVALLDALEKGALQLTEVDPSTRQALEKSSNAELKERAQRLFRSSVSADREEVIRRFKSAAAMTGDRAKGAAIFARACLQCHAMQGRGNAVGPNIYSVASQPKDTLLVSVLDPSRQVTPDYVSYTLTTTDGETMNGLITVESTSSVTLRRPNIADTTIQRSQIKELKADGKSLMPDGLEQGLTEQDIADLLEFIRQPDDRLLPEEK